jgi:signal transduction histidine kinase
MSLAKHPPRAGSRTTLVAGLLVLSVGLTLALGYQAFDAHRSHRSVAEKAVGEQASFAVWEFAGAAQRHLFNYFLRPGLDVAAGSGGKVVDRPLGEVADAAQVSRDKEWCWPDCPVTLFRVDPRTGVTELLVADPAAPSGHRREASAFEASVFASLAAGGADLIDPDWDQAVRFLSDGRVVAWRWSSDRPTVYGFIFPASVLAPHLSRVFTQSPLLPPVLAAGKDNADLLRARASAPDGIPIFASHTDVESQYRASQSLAPAFGSLVVEVSLRPEIASQLVIGGLPGSRVPWIVGLMALTLGLLAVSMQQLRRESELARLRADFVSSVSHELRTPLAQIRMFAETLLLGRVRSEAEERRSLEILVGESRRLTHLVDNVLLFSRGERGTLEVRREPTDLSTVVRDVCEAFAPLAEAADARLVCDVSPDVRGLAVGGALRQALLNLLDNATKYGPPGQTIRVGLSRLPAGRALLWVEDEGPGIPADRRRHVWEPYVRLDDHRSSAVAGSGIGLAVVRQVAEAHGGTVRIENGEERGTRFLIEVPLPPPGADP